MPLISEPNALLARYNLPKDALECTDLTWDCLSAIYADHERASGRLDPTVRYIVDSLRALPEVHSLRYRIKNPEHLVAKIIRKKLDRTTLEVTPQNYREIITDLVGIRALHLFKDEWLPIHDYVVTTWELHEKPRANIRKGDSEELRRAFESHECVVNEHPAGYRSIHYLIKSQPGKERLIAELQVRTLFEEGWSEIDHRIRYPHATDDAVLAEYLVMFNRLAGSADEMGTYVKFLRASLVESDRRYLEAEAKQAERLKELEDAISKLDIAEKEKKALEKKVRDLTAAPASVECRGIGVEFQSSQAVVLRDSDIAPGLLSSYAVVLRNSDIAPSLFSAFQHPVNSARPIALSSIFGTSTKCTVCGKEFAPAFNMLDPSRCSEHQTRIASGFEDAK